MYLEYYVAKILFLEEIMPLICIFDDNLFTNSHKILVKHDYL